MTSVTLKIRTNLGIAAALATGWWLFGSNEAHAAADATAMLRTKSVFVILMENHNWEDIEGNPKAPFLNGLMAQGAHASQDMGIPGLHPSEPNYLWLVAGNAFGVANDAEPSVNGLKGRDNLASQLMVRGLDWRSYQEGIEGGQCPLTSRPPYYVAKHNPFVFFDNLTDQFSAQSPLCIAHNRPFDELGSDLAAGKAPAFAFISPDECHDMHGHPICSKDHPGFDAVQEGDQWLAKVVPMIRKSAAYKNDGLIVITWDESEGRQDKPIGLILLSPNIRPGYVHNGRLTHSAVLRTVEDINGLPPLGHASSSPDLRDFFQQPPTSNP